MGKCSKLDRMLLNEHWANKSDWKVEGLSRRNSDHITLLLIYKKIDWGWNPIKIFDKWFDNDQCRTMMQSKLQELKGRNVTLQQKLRMVRKEIQRWNL